MANGVNAKDDDDDDDDDDDEVSFYTCIAVHPVAIQVVVFKV